MKTSRNLDAMRNSHSRTGRRGSFYAYIGMLMVVAPSIELIFFTGRGPWNAVGLIGIGLLLSIIGTGYWTMSSLIGATVDILENQEAYAASSAA